MMIEVASQPIPYRSEKNQSKLNQFISENPLMLRILEDLPRIANCGSNVLIHGESGTGKELIANLLHNESARRNGRFVAINCAAIPETLLESELFGFEKGSFTNAMNTKKGLIAEADGGTLFLDEIGDMPIHLQAKLLRVIQEKEYRALGSTKTQSVDFRLLAATNKNLKDAVQKGLFRQDLYYRINVIPIAIPALRDRPEDILPLIEHFSKKNKNLFGRLNSVHHPLFTAEAVSQLQSYPWPGNVRELENVIERLGALRSTHQPFGAEDLSLESDNYFGPRHNDRGPQNETQESSQFTAGQSLMTIEKLNDNYIEFVLERVGYHQGEAARILGISRRTIYRKLKSARHQLN